MLMATLITLSKTVNALELMSDPDDVSAVVLPVMALALVTPATRDPPDAMPLGTCTKMAGSIAAAASP